MTCPSRLVSVALALSLALSLACTSDDGPTSAGSTGESSTSGSTSAGTATSGSESSSSGGTSAGTTSTGTSTSGTTMDASSTSGGRPVACDPNNLPAEGTPCASEGEICSPGCEDPCEFCNVVECKGGTWQGLEVFPAECLACEEVCPLVLNGQCPAGPPDLGACVDGCGQNEVGECRILYHQVLACIGPAPTFACDLVGRPTVVGCEGQFEAFYACIMP